MHSATDAKNYGAHHLDSVTGHPEHLDHARNVFRDLDAKNYGAHTFSITARPICHRCRAVLVTDAARLNQPFRVSECLCVCVCVMCARDVCFLIFYLL